MKYKPGDLVISDLDGNIYTIEKFGSRDELDPLPGVVQLGNAVIATNDKGIRMLLYAWEIRPVEVDNE